MAALTPEARGDLAERLIPKALDLAGLVHGDGGAQDIDAFLRRLTLDDAGPLLVILAAMVNVEATTADILAWCTWDEFGRPLPRPGEKCGTFQAYRHHLERGELMDDACAEAGRVYYRERNRRRRNERRAREAAARENRDAA